MEEAINASKKCNPKWSIRGRDEKHANTGKKSLCNPKEDYYVSATVMNASSNYGPKAPEINCAGKLKMLGQDTDSNPGPGTYENPGMLNGKHPLIKTPGTVTMPMSKRFFTMADSTIEKRPGPADYLCDDKDPKTGKCYVNPSAKVYTIGCKLPDQSKTTMGAYKGAGPTDLSKHTKMGLVSGYTVDGDGKPINKGGITHGKRLCETLTMPGQSNLVGPGPAAYAAMDPGIGYRKSRRSPAFGFGSGARFRTTDDIDVDNMGTYDACVAD